jgi:hypothetical protein
MLYVPAGKNQDGRVALQGTGKNFGAFHAQANAVSFDR